MKIFHIALIIFSTLLLASPLKSKADNLPTCNKDFCQKVFHNKALNKATVVFWKGNSEIIETYDFSLDKKAKKIFQSSPQAISTFDADVPPTCGSDCTANRELRYETTSELIVITFVYYYDSEGNLVDVITIEKRFPRNTQPQ